MLSAAQGLTVTPIIDMRDYLDAAGLGSDIHTTSWSFVIRQRLQQSGAAANQVIIENSIDPATVAKVSESELAEMDQWLDAITADSSHRPLQVKIRSRARHDSGTREA